MYAIEWTERAPADWAELAARDPGATLFARPAWMEAVTRAYPDGRPLFAVARRDGAVAGLLPVLERRHAGLRQYLSMPFGTYGGPIVPPPEGGPCAAALLDAFRRRVGGRRTLRFELSLLDPPAAWREAIAPLLGPRLSELHTHVIDLRPGAQALWTRIYDRNTRNCVRMAERAGVTVAEEHGTPARDALHRLYVAQAATWRGSAFVSRRTLEAVAESLGQQSRLYVARHGGEPVVAVLCLEDGREIHPWLSGGTDVARRFRASHLLYHRAIAEACARGLERWHFGASMGHPGLEFFKTSLGARPRPVLRYRHVAGWWLRVRPGAS